MAVLAGYGWLVACAHPEFDEHDKEDDLYSLGEV